MELESEDAVRRQEMRVRLGWTSVGAIANANIRVGLSQRETGAVLDVPASELQAPGVEYLGDAIVELLDSDGETWKQIFSGLVGSVDIAGETAHLVLVGLQTELMERGMVGLDIPAGADAIEVFHSLMRVFGFPDERMRMHGWNRPDPEVFIVAVPVEGVAVADPHSILGIALSPTNPAQLRLPASALSDRYTTATAWASATVHERTLYDAEQAGLHLIDDALAAIHAMRSFSYPAIAGELRSFDREATRTRIKRSDVVFTGSVTSERRWLRSTSEFENRPLLDLGGDAALLMRTKPDERLRRALREWSTASNNDDVSDRVTHLWRSVEIYAKGANATTLFSPHELKSARQALQAIDGMTEKQRQRLDEVVARSNEPPLLARLEAALLRDQIALTEHEFSLLKRTRDLRNDLEHGRSPTLIESHEASRALGIMNRILVSALVASWGHA